MKSGMHREMLEKWTSPLRRVWLMAAAAAVCLVASWAMAADRQTEQREVAGFTAVSFASNGQLTVKRGSVEGLTITADAEELERIVAEVDDGVLKIYEKDKSWWRSWTRDGQPQFELTYRTLDALHVAGSGSVQTDHITSEEFKLSAAGSAAVNVPGMEATRLKMSITGSGDLDVAELAADQLGISIAGSGDIVVTGAVDVQTVSITGSGTVSATRLESRSAEVTVSGSGDVDVWVTEDLKVSVTGSGDVRYRGEAQLTRRIQGSGDISKI